MISSFLVQMKLEIVWSHCGPGLGQAGRSSESGHTVTSRLQINIVKLGVSQSTFSILILILSLWSFPRTQALVLHFHAQKSSPLFVIQVLNFHGSSLHRIDVHPYYINACNDSNKMIRKHNYQQKPIKSNEKIRLFNENFQNHES